MRESEGQRVCSEEDGPKVDSPVEDEDSILEAAFREILAMADRRGASWCNLPQEVQVVILSSENPPLKAADKMQYRQVSKAIRKLVDETAFFLVWKHVDFSPSGGQPPISRAAFRRVIDYLCERAKLNESREVEAAGGEGLFTSSSRPCFRELVDVLRENAARRARVQTAHLSDFHASHQLVAVGGKDFPSYVSPQQSEIMGRFADDIMDLADAPLRSAGPAFASPITFGRKPDMVLNVSGLQNRLFFDDLFSATRKLSEHFALHLVADGWENKTGMYSLSHFLYRRVKEVRSGLLSVQNEDDWRPVLDRIAGMGEAFGRLKVLALETGKDWKIDAQRAKELGGALVRSQTITFVSIGNLDVQNPGVLEALGRGLGVIPTLRRLRLGHVAPADSPHKDTSASALADLPESLTQLEMAGLDLTSLAVLDSLFDGLAKKESLESLSISELTPFREVSALAVVRLTEPNLGLKNLDLSTAHLRSAAAIAVLAANLAISKLLLTLSLTIVLEDSLPLLLLSSSLTKNKALNPTLAVCFGKRATRQGYEALVALKAEHGERVQLSCCFAQLSSPQGCPQSREATISLPTSISPTSSLGFWRPWWHSWWSGQRAASTQHLATAPALRICCNAFDPLLADAARKSSSGALDRASLEGFRVSQPVPFGRPIVEQIMALRDEWDFLGLDKELETAQSLSHAAASASKRGALGTRARRAQDFLQTFDSLKAGCDSLKNLAFIEGVLGSGRALLLKLAQPNGQISGSEKGPGPKLQAWEDEVEDWMGFE